MRDRLIVLRFSTVLSFTRVFGVGNCGGIKLEIISVGDVLKQMLFL